jgi:hypothetical protein
MPDHSKWWDEKGRKEFMEDLYNKQIKQQSCGCFVDVISENCSIHMDGKGHVYKSCLLCHRPL